MNLSSYQHAARETAIYPHEHSVTYPLIGLLGEAGEIANKYKKVLRDSGGVLTPDKKAELGSEIADCLWYLAALSTDLGLSLANLAEENIEKLLDRKERGVLQGSGDNR